MVKNIVAILAITFSVTSIVACLFYSAGFDFDRRGYEMFMFTLSCLWISLCSIFAYFNILQD